MPVIPLASRYDAYADLLGPDLYFLDVSKDRVFFEEGGEEHFRTWLGRYGISFDEACKSGTTFEAALAQLWQRHVEAHPEIITDAEASVAELGPLYQALVRANALHDWHAAIEAVKRLAAEARAKRAKEK
jgi:hypothetical protein